MLGHSFPTRRSPDLAAARKQLQTLRGQTHELFSSVVVARGGARLWHWSERARLTMRPLNDGFIDSYLARAGEDVLTSVGAYQLEGLGAHLFSRVDGDYFTILGLPLLPLLSFLSGHGVGLEQAAVAGERRIAANDQRAGTARGDAQRLHLGQRLGDFLRRGALGEQAARLAAGNRREIGRAHV